MDQHHVAPESIGKKIAIASLLLLIFIGAGYFFTLPWLIEKELGGELTNTYSPPSDVYSALFTITAADGAPLGWESHHTRQLPNSFMIGLINDPAYRSLSELFGYEGDSDWVINNFNTATFYFKENAVQRIDPAGKASTPISYLFVQTELGEHRMLDFDNETGALDIYTPPIPVWSAGFDPLPLTAASSFPNSQQAYTSLLNIEPLPQPPARWEKYAPCVQVTQRLDMNRPADSLNLNQIFCSSIGLVREERLDQNDQLVETLTLEALSTVDLATNPIRTWPTYAEPDTAPRPITDLANWTLTRVAQLPAIGQAAQPSQPLTFLPTDPPLLVSSHTADATNAIAAETGAVAWSFATENTNYGTPALNPHNGLIYFGSSDKKLYAVSPTGVFIDAFATQDNVVSRPVFGADTVWFASEDGHIYCLTADLDTASQHSLAMGSPVASSPVQWGDLAIFGDDGGTIVAVDATCTNRWEFNAGDPIDSPLVLDRSGTLFFASHGLIGALNPADGAEIWSTEPPESLQNGPAVSDDYFFVNDVFNILHAFDKANGKLLWSKADVAYIGTPLVVADQLVVNVDDGTVRLLNFAGEHQKSWPLAAVQLDTDVADAYPIFTPIEGADAIWLIDSAGVIYRLGAEE